MVVLSRILGYAKAPRRYLRSGFLDKLRMHVKSGTGGCGLPRYGGMGGRGGHIYFEAKEGLTLTLLSKFIKHKKIVAGMGFDSAKNGLIGQPGDDLVIHVPPGVLVYEETTLIGEVDKSGSKLLVSKGGLGGCPENQFSGQKGLSRTLYLDLKLISDVALIGFPNAGKSTLIRTISNAKPRVADYPFTTMKPHLGTMKFDDLREITIADLPGLIEGAHKDKGKGHKFLKHLERSKMLLFVIDIQGFQLSNKYDWRSSLETILLLNREIELYKPELLNMPAMLLLNKMDTENASSIAADLRPKVEKLSDYVSELPENERPKTVLKFEDIMFTSLALKNDIEIKELKNRIRKIIDKVTDYEDPNLNDTCAETELIERLRRATRQIAPVLL